MPCADDSERDAPPSQAPLSKPPTLNPLLDVPVLPVKSSVEGWGNVRPVPACDVMSRGLLLARPCEFGRVALHCTPLYPAGLDSSQVGRKVPPLGEMPARAGPLAPLQVSRAAVVGVLATARPKLRGRFTNRTCGPVALTMFDLTVLYCCTCSRCSQRIVWTRWTIRMQTILTNRRGITQRVARDISIECMCARSMCDIIYM
eukprot:COSAG01_NODE_2460_length_7655_cov_15.411858_7_plen_202_part_00